MGNFRPKVLMVLGAYYPEGSGISFQCRELILALRNHVDFTVLTTTLDRNLPAEEDVEGIPVRRIFVRPREFLSKIWASFKMGFAFFVLRDRFEIVHLHSVTDKNLLIACLAKLLRKKLMLRLATGGTDEPSAAFSKGPLHRWAFSHADLYSIVSPKILKLCLAAGLDPELCRLSPDGINVERFFPATPNEKQQLRKTLGLPLEGRLILFVGFFSQEKRPQLLFEAWSKIQNQPGMGPTHLVFIGATQPSYQEVDPSLADQIRAQAAEQGLGRHLIFVERTLEMEKYLRSGDLFVLTSTREGMPNALLEAMASGLCSLASWLPGVTDTLIEDNQTGLLYPAGDALALSEKLEWALLHPDQAQRLAAQGREAVIRSFSIQARAQRVLKLYEFLSGISSNSLQAAPQELIRAT